jgi:hypothetical protein
MLIECYPLEDNKSHRCTCGASFTTSEELISHLKELSDAADFRQHMPISDV